MPDWPVGISTGGYYQTSIFDCLEPIRHAGFLTIEVCSFPAHLDYHDIAKVEAAARLMQTLGMEAYSFHAPLADYIDISSPDEQQRKYSLDEILRAAQAAAAMGVRYFVIHPGPEKTLAPSAEERLLRLANTAQALNVVAERCEHYGIGLVLENMLPHLLFGNTSDMLWIMGAMKSLRVGTCLDTTHALLSGDIYRVMYKLSGHLQLIHANDTHGFFDDHITPGKGIIDWHRLFAEISETGFQGGIILEIAGNGDISRQEEFLEAAREGRTLLRDISRRLELAMPPTGRFASGTDENKQRKEQQ